MRPCCRRIIVPKKVVARLLKLAATFLAESLVDAIKLLVTTVEDIWLRLWSADPSSKQSWCKITFGGLSLFGDKLDSAIPKGRRQRESLALGIMVEGS